MEGYSAGVEFSVVGNSTGGNSPEGIIRKPFISCLPLSGKTELYVTVFALVKVAVLSSTTSEKLDMLHPIAVFFSLWINIIEGEKIRFFSNSKK